MAAKTTVGRYHHVSCSPSALPPAAGGAVRPRFLHAAPCAASVIHIGAVHGVAAVLNRRMGAAQSLGA